MSELIRTSNANKPEMFQEEIGNYILEIFQDLYMPEEMHLERDVWELFQK